MNDKLNTLIVTGIILNTIFSLFFISSQETEFIKFTLITLSIPLLTSYIGIYMVLNDNLKWGYRLILIGSALFVPIGIIAILGVNKIKKSQEDSTFEERKRELEK